MDRKSVVIKGRENDNQNIATEKKNISIQNKVNDVVEFDIEGKIRYNKEDMVYKESGRLFYDSILKQYYSYDGFLIYK